MLPSAAKFLGVALLACACVAPATAGVIHDATADFSNASNPTGGAVSGWGYNNSIANGAGPVGPNVANWNAADFGTGQRGWEGNAPPVWDPNYGPAPWQGWAKITQNPNNYDVQVGDVVTHGYTSIAYQFQSSQPDGSSGFATLSGNLWDLRDNGSATGTWKIWKNDTTLITSGSINDTSSRAAPVDFTSGSDGSGALLNIPYVAGDYFRLEVLQDDFVGINFTVVTVPEPSTYALLLAGAAAAALVRRRKRSQRLFQVGPPPVC
jgi:hypothetical protein